MESIQPDTRGWLLRVLAWDGLLPFAVLLTPTIIEFLLPNNRPVIELVSILLPITAFCIRYNVGKRHINSNNCSTAVRRFQFSLFVTGIIALVLIEGLVIIAWHLVARPGVVFDDDAVRIVFGVLVAVYCTSMIVAMYPGRQKQDERTEPTL
jgi:hypothetical protein